MVPAELCQKRTRTEALASISGAAHGFGAACESMRVRSKAWGRSGPSNATHPVGGWR